MQRIDTATKSPDLFGVGKHGYRDGNVSLGIPATQLNAAVFNAIQEEISNVIEGAGAVLNPASYTQLKTAITAMITAAAAAFATNAEAQALSATDKIISPATLGAAFGGANQGSGYQKLPGGLVLQWGITGVITAGQSQTITFPIAFPNACYIAMINRKNNVITSTMYNWCTDNFTTTSFLAINGTQSDGPGTWFAIGH